MSLCCHDNPIHVVLSDWTAHQLIDRHMDAAGRMTVEKECVSTNLTTSEVCGSSPPPSMAEGLLWLRCNAFHIDIVAFINILVHIGSSTRNGSKMNVIIFSIILRVIMQPEVHVGTRWGSTPLDERLVIEFNWGGCHWLHPPDHKYRQPIPRGCMLSPVQWHSLVL